MNLIEMSPQNSLWRHHRSLHTLKRQLYEKHKQVKKAEKQARIQHLHSQLTEMDHQLDMLRQKASAQPTLGKSSSQPVATSTLQMAAHQDQSWFQQADIDVADVFLNQLDDTPVKGSDNHGQVEKSSKPSKKQKPAQPCFMLLEQKCQHLDVLKVSSDQSPDEPLGELSVTSSSDSDSTVKRFRHHKK